MVNDHQIKHLAAKGRWQQLPPPSKERDSPTSLNALAGAAWEFVSSKYLSHEKALESLYPGKNRELPLKLEENQVYCYKQQKGSYATHGYWVNLVLTMDGTGNCSVYSYTPRRASFPTGL